MKPTRVGHISPPLWLVRQRDHRGAWWASLHAGTEYGPTVAQASAGTAGEATHAVWGQLVDITMALEWIAERPNRERERV